MANKSNKMKEINNDNDLNLKITERYLYNQ